MKEELNHPVKLERGYMEDCTTEDAWKLFKDKLASPDQNKCSFMKHTNQKGKKTLWVTKKPSENDPAESRELSGSTKTKRHQRTLSITRSVQK